MNTLLIDLDGVIYQGGQAIAGAAEAVSWVQRRNIPHLFLTNTTSRPRQALVKKLLGMGIATNASHILTPAVAASQWITRNIQGDIALFIPHATQTDFQGLPLAKPDQTENIGAVVIGDLGELWDFATLNRAFRMLKGESHPALIALGMTRYWLAEDGLRLDAGPFVSALQYASGRTPVVLGKPAREFYQAALDLLQASAGLTCMIGDDIRSDIEGAQHAGINALLVKTGKFHSGDLQLGITPLALLDSVAELPRWWQNNAKQCQ